MHSSLALLFPVLLAAVGFVAGAQQSQAARDRDHFRSAASIWFHRALAFAGSDLLTGVLVLLIAILTTLNLILLFPSLGVIVSECNQF